MTTTSAAIRKAALFARTTTDTLIQSGLILEAKANRNNDERMTLAWINGEIERRCGGVQDENRFADLMDRLDSTVLALMAYFPELAA